MTRHPFALSLSKGCSLLRAKTDSVSTSSARTVASVWATTALAPIPAYVRYGAASAFALGVDLATFFTALESHVPAAFASAIGYGCGIAAHWVVASRLVFGDSAAAGRERHRQKLLFVVTAFAGFGATVAIVGLGARLGLDPRLAKLAAIGVSFQSGWLLRRKLVFA